MKHCIAVLLLLAMACDPGSGEKVRDNREMESIDLATSKESRPTDTSAPEPAPRQEMGSWSGDWWPLGWLIFRTSSLKFKSSSSMLLPIIFLEKMYTDPYPAVTCSRKWQIC